MGKLKVGVNLAFGLQNISFEAAGATDPGVVEIIQLVDNIGSSYDPKETNNSLTGGFVVDGQYFIVMKVEKEWAFLQTKAVGNTPYPTGPVTDDTANTFNWTHPVGFTTADEETTVDGGTTWVPAVKPLVVGNVDKVAGTVGVRVKATPARPASTILYNAVPFVANSAAFDPDALNYINRATAAGSLTQAEKNAVNQFFLDAKAHGYFPNLKVVKIYFGGAAVAKINAVSNTFPDVWTNLTYARFGVTGSGTGSYAKCGFIPSAELSANSYSYGAYIAGPNTVENEIEMGASNGTDAPQMYLLPRAPGAQGQPDVTYAVGHSGAAAVNATGQTDSNGMWQVTRQNATTLKLFRNGVQVGPTVTTNETSALPNVEWFTFAANLNGAITASTKRPHAMDFLTSGMTDQNCVDFNADFTNFLIAAG